MCGEVGLVWCFSYVCCDGIIQIICLICVISKTDRQRQYNWNIVESGIKHHNPSWDKTSVTKLCFSRSTIFDRLVKECSNSLKALNCIKTYQECSFNRFLLFCFSIDQKFNIVDTECHTGIHFKQTEFTTIFSEATWSIFVDVIVAWQ